MRRAAHARNSSARRRIAAKRFHHEAHEFTRKEQRPQIGKIIDGKIIKNHG